MVSWPPFDLPFVPSNPRELYAFIFKDGYWFVYLQFVSMVKFHIIIIHSLELFTSAFADGFSLESQICVLKDIGV